MPGIVERLAAMLSRRSTAPETEVRRDDHVEVVAVDDPRLPSGARASVARLLELVAAVEARGSNDPLAAPVVAEARQIRDRHLPLLVSSYAAIPASHRAEIFRETGRSASYELGESIGRMIARLEEVVDSSARDGIAGFDDARRFIEQRYGGPRSIT